MAKPKKKSGSKLASVEVKYPEQISLQYSNFVKFNIGGNDIIFDFGVATPKGGEAEVTIQNRIVMSPTHAKQFAQKLVENIKKYEDNFGLINFEPKRKK